MILGCVLPFSFSFPFYRVFLFFFSFFFFWVSFFVPWVLWGASSLGIVGDEDRTEKRKAHLSTNLSIFLPRARTHTHTHTHTHALTLALTGEDQTRTAARGLFSQASSPHHYIVSGTMGPCVSLVGTSFVRRRKQHFLSALEN